VIELRLERARLSDPQKEVISLFRTTPGERGDGQVVSNLEIPRSRLHLTREQLERIIHTKTLPTTLRLLINHDGIEIAWPTRQDKAARDHHPPTTLAYEILGLKYQKLSSRSFNEFAQDSSKPGVLPRDSLVSIKEPAQSDPSFSPPCPFASMNHLVSLCLQTVQRRGPQLLGVQSKGTIPETTMDY
jgi:hypothetical protein